MPAKQAKRKDGKKKAKRASAPRFVVEEHVDGVNSAEGAVIVWDTGTYRNETEGASGEKIGLGEAIEHGHVEFRLNGTKLRGGYSLTRLTEAEDGRERWLLVKDEVRDLDQPA
jgi:hypothetical protein